MCGSRGVGVVHCKYQQVITCADPEGGTGGPDTPLKIHKKYRVS